VGIHWKSKLIAKIPTAKILKLERYIKSLEAQRDVLREGLKVYADTALWKTEYIAPHNMPECWSGPGRFGSDKAQEALSRCDELEGEGK